MIARGGIELSVLRTGLPHYNLMIAKEEEGRRKELPVGREARDELGGVEGRERRPGARRRSRR